MHLRVFLEVFLAFLENLRQFHRLVPIAYLPALGTSRLFSRAWHSLHAVSSSSDYFITADLPDQPENLPLL